jgi:tetratricopeptide (TPR) repeat protein
MLVLKNHSRSHSPAAQRALEAADGYLFLGLIDEALAEVSRIHEAEQDTPSVLLSRIRVLLHLRRWTDAELLARRAARRHPEEEEFTVQRAFALRQLEKGEEAFKVLRAAPDWLRRTGILHYNLGCYEARLGDPKTARRCIDAAIELNAAMKTKARTDPDLAGL